MGAWLHIGEGLAVRVWCLMSIWLARRDEVHNLCVPCVRENGCAAGGVGGNAWLCLCYAERTTDRSCGTEVVEESPVMVSKVVVILWGCTVGKDDSKGTQREKDCGLTLQLR